MYGYNRRSTYHSAEVEYLRHRYRYVATPKNARYSTPDERERLRNTQPPFSSRRVNSRHTAPPPLSKRRPQDTLPPNMGVKPRDPVTLPSKGEITSEDENNPVVGYYLAHIVQGIWKLFADMPLRPRIACILLALLALVILSIMLNFMMQLAAPIMSLIYTILGIFASIIAIYEFLNQGRKKRS